MHYIHSVMDADEASSGASEAEGEGAGAMAVDEQEQQQGSLTPRVPPPPVEEVAGGEDDESEGGEDDEDDSFEIDDAAMETVEDAGSDGGGAMDEGDDDQMPVDGEGGGSAAGGDDDMVTPQVRPPADVPPRPESAKAKKQKRLETLIKGYFAQIVGGCGSADCANLLCRSCEDSVIITSIKAGGVELSKNDAAKLAVQLAQKSLEEDYLCASCRRGEHPLAVIEDHRQRVESIKDLLPAPWPQQIDAALEARRTKYLCTRPPGAPVLDLATVRQHCEAFSAGGDIGALVKFVGQAFSDERALSFAFLKAGTVTSAEDCGLDVEAVAEGYSALYSVGEEAVGNAMTTAVGNLVKTLRMTTESHFDSHSLVEMRQFIVLLLDPSLIEYACEETHQRQVLDLMFCMTSIPEKTGMQELLVSWLAKLGEEVFTGLLTVFHMYITVRITSATVDEHDRRIGLDSIFPAVKMLALLHKANEKFELGYAGDEDFYNDAVNELVNMKEDYSRRWLYWVPEAQRRRLSGTQFSFCNYPFILNAYSKSVVIQTDGQRQMDEAFRQNLLQHVLMGGGQNPHLVVKVSRENLLNDATQQFSKPPDELKRPLRVKFKGEEGVDEGGVKREFFLLLTPKLLNLDLGMFTYNKSSRNFWFREGMPGMELGVYFELLGKIVAVAIYNGVILDLPFPRCLWRRMVTGSEQVSLEDLKEIDPEMAHGLQQLLEFDGDVQETFELTFTHDSEQYGQLISRDLKPGGKELAVTNENRAEYVELYVNHIVNTLPKNEIAEFVRGFKMVMDGQAFQLLKAHELELIVVGSPELDIAALEDAARYEDTDEGGFNENHVAVGYFWSYAKGLGEEGRKKLLTFITSSDRVPVGGCKNLRIVISKHGDNTHLPAAHTCFNHLLLPEYDSQEQLQQKFDAAISEGGGFHIV